MYEAKALDILPGIFKEASEYASQGRYVDGDNVRFWKGFPERIGGNEAIAEQVLIAPARGIISWRAIDGTQLMAFGHARGVDVLQGGSLFDVTPEGTSGYTRLLLTTGTVTGTFSTGEAVTSSNGGSGSLYQALTTTPGYVTGANGTLRMIISGISVTTFIARERVTTTGGGTAIMHGAISSNGPIFLWAPSGTLSGTITGSASGATATLIGSHVSGATTVTGHTITVTIAAPGVVTLATHGFTQGAPVVFTTTGALPTGITASTTYYVSATGITANTFQLSTTYANAIAGTSLTTSGSQSGTHSMSATASPFAGALLGGGGDDVQITAVSEVGVIDGGATTAWGEGAWGGTGTVWGGVESLYSSVDDPTTWTFVQWGEDLIGCPREGKIYVLDASTFIGATTTNMTLISQAPSNALGIFMSDANRTLVAYGAYDDVAAANDPLNIRWCDEENYTIWTAASTNTAGSIRCENGSVIVGHMSCRGGHLIATDAAIFLFRYIGLPFVYSLTQAADGVSMISPHAGAEMDGVTFWMSTDGFYYYDGSVQPLPCDVHAYVFGRLNTVQAYKVTCSTIRAYNEVWWYYVSVDESEVDSYVCYNTVEKTWSIGSKSRTSMLDSSVTVSYPVGTEEDGTINAEEYGTTDNGTDLEYMLTTSDIEVDDGTVFLHNRMLIPDYDRISGTHEVTIQCRGWPARTATTKGPYSVTSTTEKISVRARGRMLRFLFEGSDDFRLGRWRYRVTGHGRKE